jgi:hypothetical protein
VLFSYTTVLIYSIFIYWYPYTPKTRQALNRGLKTPVFSLVKMTFPVFIFFTLSFLI